MTSSDSDRSARARRGVAFVSLSLPALALGLALAFLAGCYDLTPVPETCPAEETLVACVGDAALDSDLGPDAPVDGGLSD